jgi:hypothetical protein
MVRVTEMDSRSVWLNVMKLEEETSDDAEVCHPNEEVGGISLWTDHILSDLAGSESSAFI